MATIASAYVELLPSFRGGAAAISKDLNPAVKKASEGAGDEAGQAMGTRMGAGIKSLVGPAIAAVGAAGVVSFFKDSIGAASDLAETVNKSNTIFGDNAAQINKWATGAAVNMGLSKAAALEAAAGFGNMFSQLGFAGDQAATMSTDVVQLAADLGSFNNLPTADVADMMSAAFRGEYDSLQRLIPNINAARVEQEALAMTGKTAASELTAQEKAAATLAIVQRDGAAAAGDYAKTSDDLANSSKTASATFDDMKAALGDRLLPVVTEIMTYVRDTGLPALEDFGAWFEDNKGKVGAFAGAVGALTAVMIAHGIAMNVNAAGGVLAYLATLGPVRLATAAWAAVQWLLNAAMTANPIGIVIAVIAALVAGIILAYKNSETFRTIVQGLWAAIKTAGEWIADLGRKVKEWVIDKFELAKVGLEVWVKAFKDFKLPDWVQKVADLVGSIAGGLKSGAGKVGEFFGGLFGDGPGRAGTKSPVGGNTLKKVQDILPPGARVTSTYRTPAQNRAVGGVPSSYHIDRNNPAVDIGGSTAVLDKVYSTLRMMGPWRELLWRVPGHFDHVHVAHQGGTVSSNWPTIPGLRADERPVIAQVGEDIVPRGQAGRGGVVNNWTVQNYGTPLTASQLVFAERSRAALDPVW